MTRAAGLALLLAIVGARPVAAQCGIDLIETGIGAYRDLQLETAQELLNGAIELNERVASRCATETARALTYLGASYWLRELPDSAHRSFERAVIRAPRFRPDALEFPPDITDAFDRVRRRTPAVAAALPDAVEIGPEGEAALFIRMAASTTHQVTASIRTASGDTVRTLYRGPITTVAEGMIVEWNGRDSEGWAVPSGRYELEVISQGDAAEPLRKVVVPLTIESDAPAEPEPPAAEPLPAPMPAPPADEGSVWAGIGAAAAGLAGGALVIGIPPVVNGFPESGARYVVGVSLGVAGLVGLVQQLRRGEPGPPIPSFRRTPYPSRPWSGPRRIRRCVSWPGTSTVWS